ncbi:MAG: hypothetical protein IPK60_23450 [Sandaracinaceae bacterium]|nr:hypothetical protein [Sandaracinaceae bacterium]
MSKKVTIAYHGHCFDGMSSAAVLTRFFRARMGESTEFTYRGLDHQPGGSFVPNAVLDGEENAVVDFRYTTSPALTWFFDHHKSGIVGEEEQRHFDADTSGQKFFDPTYGSCCKLIVDITKSKFAHEAPELADLVDWADLIDAARFPTPSMPVELKEPALKMMTVVEVHGSDKFLAPRIEKLSRGVTLAEIASEKEVQDFLAPLLTLHEKTLTEIKARARCESGVVTFDLVGLGSDRYNKFIPYWLFPDSRYCVAITAGKSRAKVSVGSNPWAKVSRTHDISAICAKYGGGGHPVVGAVSVPPSEVEKARTIAREIIETLSHD